MSTNTIEQSIKELRRLTGLPIEIDLSHEVNLEKVEQQITALCNAYKDVTNRETLIKRWLLSNMSDEEFFSYSSRVHLNAKERRGIFFIQFEKEADPVVLTILKNMFSETESIVFPIQPDQLLVIRQFPARKKISMKEKAYEIMDILNTELMAHVNISYSQICNHLNQLPGAYQETVLALQIGQLFYPDRNIYGYDELGIGPLLYGLPKEVCMKYICHNLGEYFLENDSIIFQKEILDTANCFLKNNLNIAETARQLHIHRNTLLYRLEQIQNETGLDIRKFEAAMTFKLCSMILHYLR